MFQSLAEQSWPGSVASPTSLTLSSQKGDESVDLLNRLLSLEYQASNFYAHFGQHLSDDIDASLRMNLHLSHARELVKLIALRKGLPEASEGSKSATHLFATLSTQLPKNICRRFLDASADARERDLVFRYHRTAQFFSEPEKSLLLELEREIAHLLEKAPLDHEVDR